MKIEKEARLLVLDPKHANILSFNSDGGDLKVFLKGMGAGDGIAVDVANRHIYWTNMGVNTPGGERFELNDGSIERIDFDGSNRTVIIPSGATFTPKQMVIDTENKMLYWCDREGMRVMCSATERFKHHYPCTKRKGRCRHAGSAKTLRRYYH